MGRIYRAEQEPLKREVALKILSRPLLGTTADDAALEKRFLLEAATCGRLRHPNTVTVFDYGALDLAGEQTFYMVMEFVRGRTISQAIRAEGPLRPARAVRVAFEICRSLREAHREGVVHRDLKPSNVMLVPTEEGEAVKVLDFGVAKVMAEGAESLTTDGSFVGSPRYTAPEQVKQEHVDGRADLYALGVLLFEMLSGAPPFSSNEPVRTLMMHINDPVPPLLAPEPVPPALEALIRRLLEKEASARPADADAVIAALRATRLLPLGEFAEPTMEVPVDEVTEENAARVAPVAPFSTAAPPSTGPGRGRWLFAGIGLAGVMFLGLVALVGGAWWLGAFPSVAKGPDRPPEVPVDEALRVMSEAMAPPELLPPAPLVVLRSTPSGASVWLDGAEVGTTPHELSLDSARPLRVEVRAAGYRARVIELSGPDDDGVVDVVLEKLPRAVARPPTGGANDDIRLER